MSFLFIVAIFASISLSNGCFSGGEYSETEKKWCQHNIDACAANLCNTRTNQDCNQNEIEDIALRLKCKFYGQCDHLRNDDKYPCINNNDCAVGRLCREGSCKLVYSGKSCVFDGQCDHHYSCIWKQCVLSTILNCTHNQLCPVGMRCKYNTCKLLKDKNACSKDYDCHPFYNCQNSECILTDTSTINGMCNRNRNCDAGFKCRQNKCKAFKTGTICNNARQCLDSDYECKNSECVLINNEKRCQFNSQCDPDNICYNGKCQSYKIKPNLPTKFPILPTNVPVDMTTTASVENKCSWDEQCGVGQTCKNRQCT